jgi:hypothetical protein
VESGQNGLRQLANQTPNGIALTTSSRRDLILRFVVPQREPINRADSERANRPKDKTDHLVKPGFDAIQIEKGEFDRRRKRDNDSEWGSEGGDDTKT